MNQDLSQDYPRTKFHPEFGIRVAQTPEAEELLGEGWYDTPADFPVVEVDPNEPSRAPGCAQCQKLFELLKEQTDKFDISWRRLSEQHDAAVQELASLKAEHEATVQELAALKAKAAKATAAAKASATKAGTAKATTAEPAEQATEPAETEAA